jgi:hypothetical protein
MASPDGEMEEGLTFRTAGTLAMVRLPVPGLQEGTALPLKSRRIGEPEDR